MKTHKKKIIIFSVVHRWNDTRVFYKQATSLAKKYHVVLYISAPFKHRTKNNVRIIGLPLWRKKIFRIITQMRLLPVLLKSKAEVYHFHDPELILSGLILKWIKKVSVIYDKHENIPFGIIGNSGSLGFISKCALGLYTYFEKLADNYLDKVIIAEESYSENFRHKPLAVYNYPIVPYMDVINTPEKKYSAIYVGGVTLERGIIDLIKISKILKGIDPKSVIRVIGPIMDNSHEIIEKNIHFMGVENNIILSDYLPYDRALTEMKRAHVGLALLHPDNNYIRSIPQKIFEYLVNGIPFIASDFPYWKKIIGSNPPGWFFPYNDHQNIADTIWACMNKRLFSEEELIAKVKRNFCWTTEEEKLFNLYQRMMGS